MPARLDLSDGKKYCPKCEHRLLLKFFGRRKGGGTGYNAWCKECNRNRNNIRNRALRLKVLSHYSEDGIPRCACCDNQHIEFLALDHINGGGSQQRKTIKIRWWEWIRRNGYPKGFRVLCHNCNQSLGIYGYCPHATDTSRFTDDAVVAYDENTPSRSYKLTDEQVSEIRAAITNGTPQNQLVRKYKVSRANICRIHKQKSRISSTLTI